MAIAIQFARVQGPVVAPFMPMAVTLWTGADALTAFLLLALFWIDGSVYLAYVASAYVVTGALSIPYLINFPGVFVPAGGDVAAEQVSIYIWSAWHLIFALVLTFATLADRRVRRRVAAPHRFGVLLFCVAGSLSAAAAVAVAVDGAPAILPVLVAGGYFTPLFTHVVAPLLSACIVVAIAAIMVLARPLRPLHAWLIVALAIGLLDTLLNAFSNGRYSVPWYVGKLETLLGASILLAILLGDIVALFARSFELSAIDALTGLRNRRAFDEYVTRAFAGARRRQSSLAVIMIDVDRFKQFNDRFGHAAGDRCLRKISAVLRESAARSEDLAARYGGEEFVVILPATPLAGAQVVAEEIRRGIEALGIAHPDNEAGVVTVSLGISFSQRGAGDPSGLFELADRALYDAKRGGRNRVSVSNVEFVPPSTFRTA